MPELIQDSANIRLNTNNEVDQVLGGPPSWLLQWGISIVFIVVIVFGVIAWLIKYPDIIPAKVQILTENPAIRVVARVGGKIVDLRVFNHEAVKKGQVIAVLDNTAQLKDVLLLTDFMKKVEACEAPLDFIGIKPPENLVLGTLQTSYAGLAQKINEYVYFLKNRGVPDKIETLKAQIIHIQKLNDNLDRQKQTLTQEVSLVQKGFLRQQKLHSEGVVSDVDLENSKNQYLQYNRQLEVWSNQIISNDINIEQLNAQIIDLKQGLSDGQFSRELEIRENVDRIKGEIKIWRQTYLIIAPITGKVSFSKIWSEQQFINANEVVLAIVPHKGVGKMVGKAILPVSNSGKVKKGQTANIRLNGFPYREYGILKAEVQDISLVPVTLSGQEGRESYLLEIALPDSLVTTYGKHIPFRQEMQGEAQIVTEDRRVLKRIFDRVNSILKNS